MANSKTHLASATAHSNRESIAETFVEIKMEQIGDYGVHEDITDKKLPRLTISTKINEESKPTSPVSPVSPEKFHDMTSPMAEHESQPRSFNYPVVVKPPEMARHKQSTQEDMALSESYIPGPNTEGKGKWRAPHLSTLSKSKRKMDDGKEAISKLQKQLSQSTKLTSQLESQLIRSSSDISRLEIQLCQNNNSLAETEAKLQASYSKCRALQMKLDDATEDLKQTQEHVFRLQPRQQRITQSDALAAYTAICDSVQSWVGFHLDSILDEGRINITELDASSASKLIKLLTPMGLKGTRFAETDEFNLVAAVMEFLRSEVFEMEFYGAVATKDLDLLRKILRNMENLRPPQDLERRHTWRSETLGALVCSDDFNHQRQKRIQVLSEQLLRILGVIDLEILNAKCLESVQRNIVEPAVNLAHQLHLSIDRFRVQWGSGEQVASRDGPSILERYDCSNVLSNGKPVRLEGKERLSRDAVSYLFDIMPGLYCQSFKEDTVTDLKVLKKPKGLVAVAKPGRSISIPLAGNGGTILGNVYDRLRSGKA